jgi:hypothetical protein
MNDEISVVKYLSARVGNKPGEGRRLLEHISERGINLDGFAAFPVGDNTTELVFITERTEIMKEAAADAGVELQGPNRAFLIYGRDRIGLLHQHHLTLANAGVNVYSSSGVGSQDGRFYFLLWVRPEDFTAAANAFGFV